MKNITVAIDFSDFTQALLDKALELGAAFHSKLHLVHVAAAEPNSVGFGPYIYPGSDQREKEMAEEKARLREMVEDIRNRGVPDAAAYMKEGDPVPTLLHFADEHESDLLILGSHHRSFVSRLLMGDPAAEAVRKATRPVLVVPTDG